MSMDTKSPGAWMAAESAEALAVFGRAAAADHSALLAPLNLGALRALYTIARGSLTTISIASQIMLSYL